MVAVLKCESYKFLYFLYLFLAPLGGGQDTTIYANSNWKIKIVKLSPDSPALNKMEELTRLAVATLAQKDLTEELYGTQLSFYQGHLIETLRNGHIEKFQILEKNLNNLILANVSEKENKIKLIIDYDYKNSECTFNWDSGLIYIAQRIE